jgi:hypothetical protein
MYGFGCERGLRTPILGISKCLWRLNDQTPKPCAKSVFQTMGYFFCGGEHSLWTA